MINCTIGRFLMFAALLAVGLDAAAQFVRSEELEKYAKERYGDSWKNAALALGDSLTLDKEGALTWVQVIEVPGRSRDAIYNDLNQWYSATFNDANAVIKLNDREAGTIIGQGYIHEAAVVVGGMGRIVDLQPIIRCDIKEGRARVCFNIPYYTIVVTGGLLLSNVKPRTETWPIDKTFPFDKSDSYSRTSSKALVMAHCFSMVLMDKLEHVIKEGLSGAPSDDW